eukprot:895977-Amorphochlora_amoeboformis.AAC.1
MGGLLTFCHRVLARNSGVDYESRIEQLNKEFEVEFEGETARETPAVGGSICDRLHSRNPNFSGDNLNDVAFRLGCLDMNLAF